MQSYTQPPNLTAQGPSISQARTIYVSNPSQPQQIDGTPVPPLQLNRQPNLQFTSSLTPRPVSTVEAPPLRNSLPVSQSQIVVSSEIHHSGKYGNKYSFKRNSTTRSKAVSFANRESVEARAVIGQQEVALACIRLLAASRRGVPQSAAMSQEGVLLWNTLSEVYNISLVGNSSGLKPLEFIVPAQNSFQKVGQRAAQIQQASQPAVQSVPLARPPSSRLNGSIEQPKKPQFNPADIVNYSAVNNSADLYTLEIRELRNKIQAYEQQKMGLVDRIHTLEQTHNLMGGQENIEHYRQEINTLREQISHLSDIYHAPQSTAQEAAELKDVVTQYEEQLIQAQNHIHYLENTRSQESAVMEGEIAQLRDAIAKYSQHIEQAHHQQEAVLEEFASTKTELNNTKAELAHANAELAHANAELAHTNAELTNTKASLAEAQQQIDRLLNQLPQKGAKFDEKVKIQRLTNRLTELTFLLDKNQNQNSSLKDLLNTKEKQLTKQAQKFNKLNEQLKATQFQLENKRAESAQLSLQIETFQLELTKCQSQADQTKQYLIQAEDYILELQQSQKIIIAELENQKNALKAENSTLINEIASVKDDLNTAKAEAEIYQARAATAAAEYEDMELRYRQTIESLNSRYDQLLDERNSITSKLSVAQDTPLPTLPTEEAEALRQSLNQLSLQVTESQHHLHIAEDYIQQNMSNWQNATLIKQQYDQQQAFVDVINADLEKTRKQNLELQQRIKDFEKIVVQAEALKAENEKLTIIIREKDKTPPSTSLDQNDELQYALANMTLINNQNQTKISELVSDIEILKTENDELKNKLAKIDQLEEYLTRAEHFIIQQEEKFNLTINNYESENKDLKQHLIKAEDYILALQQEAEENKKLIIKLEEGRKAQIKRANDLHEALIGAESHIFDMAQDQKQ